MSGELRRAIGTLGDRDATAAASALASLTAVVASQLGSVDAELEQQVVDAVAAALVRHSSTVEVATLSFALLSTLSRSGALQRHPECVVRSAEAVVDCIGQRGCSGEVMSSGLWLLGNLARECGHGEVRLCCPCVWMWCWGVLAVVATARTRFVRACVFWRVWLRWTGTECRCCDVWMWLLM